MITAKRWRWSYKKTAARAFLLAAGINYIRLLYSDNGNESILLKHTHLTVYYSIFNWA